MGEAARVANERIEAQCLSAERARSDKSLGAPAVTYSRPSGLIHPYRCSKRAGRPLALPYDPQWSSKDQQE